MRWVKAVLLVFVIIAAVFMLYYTIDSISDSRYYAVTFPENSPGDEEIEDELFNPAKLTEVINAADIKPDSKDK